jgi:hypothetical protein
VVPEDRFLSYEELSAENVALLGMVSELRGGGGGSGGAAG